MQKGGTLGNEADGSSDLGLKSVYRTATSVKVGTFCVDVLSNFREFENSRTASERGGVYTSQAFV